MDKDGKKITSITRNILIDSRTKGTMFVDEPSTCKVEGKTMKTWGWMMSNDKDAKIKIYIDGVEKEGNITRVIREDVLKHFNNGYGGREANPKPGYEATIDISNISYGRHTVKYAAIDNKELAHCIDEYKFIPAKDAVKELLALPKKVRIFSTHHNNIFIFLFFIPIIK